MRGDTKQLGDAGETAARQFLVERGYDILATNYLCREGEIDIICFHSGTIVFVEVKTRSSDDDALPEENITPRKRRQMENAARSWLNSRKEPDCAYRFDALSIVISPRGQTRVRQIEEAFLPSRALC